MTRAKRHTPPAAQGTPDQAIPLQTSATEAIEHLHEKAKLTQNPLYAWQALQFCLWSQVKSDRRADDDLIFAEASVIVPSWIAEYLQSVAGNILLLASGTDFRTLPKAENVETGGNIRDIDDFIDFMKNFPWKGVESDDAGRLWGQALGLSRPGHSSIDRLATDQADIQAYHRLSDVRLSGASYQNAVTQLANEIGKEESVARKSAARGKKLIAERFR